MWQINFAASPQTLPELDHTLRVDERMLRWMVFKRQPYRRLPTPYNVARIAENVAIPLAQQQAAKKKQR
jgi:ribosomal protein S6